MEISTVPNVSSNFNETNNARILPTVVTGVSSDKARSEFLSLEPIVGAAFCHALERKSVFSNPRADTSLLIDSTCATVSTDCLNDLKSVLHDKYFNPYDGRLRRFCTESLLCLTHSPDSYSKNRSSLDSLGTYFSEVFLTQAEREQLNSVGQSELHLLDRQVRGALQVKSQPRASDLAPLRKYFESDLISSCRTDINSLSRNTGALLTHIDAVIRIYLFHYITEVVRHLTASVRGLPDKIQEEELRGLYYILEGEHSSASRMSVTNGWSSVKDVFSDVFTHVNCLEVLNHVRREGRIPLDYSDIARDRSIEMLSAVKQVINDFASTASSWKDGPFSYGDELKSGILQLDSSAAVVAELWKLINIQISNSSRDAVGKRVRSWFEKFAYGSLLQQRGRFGYLAVLPIRYLHLLVFLAVEESTQERIRLKELWSAFHRRGFRFDEISKSCIVENLESIGVLETRSDSGDARYVRSPF
jgi:DNA phosphorothioation-dependent restriction protein DptG